ncbi:MAG: glycosyltransferase [Planctomycetes bacterium]|nr:glycosyltransferase [Planctomycetota bacterium]
MNIAFMIWSGLLVLIAVLWASRHLALSRNARLDKPLSSGSSVKLPTPAPKVSMLVAAKDEEANIEACVTSMLSQDYPAFEVFAINDRSTDRTREIIDGITSQNGIPYTPLHVAELREGWFGKNNAMHEGVLHAQGEWLCFTDADCRQTSDKTISVAVSYAVENQIDLLSVLPVLETKSFWERVLQPVCAAILVMWFRPEKVNDPKSSASYANGAFMLMRRDLYDAIGGHERVKTEVNEDMHMARLTKESGRRLHVIQNDDLYRTRMYANFGECWRGWTRIFYGCFGSFRRLAVSAIVLALSSLLPWCSLFAGLVGWLVADEGSAWRWIFLASVAAIVMQQSLLVRFYRVNRASSWYVPTYFIGAVIAFGMLLNAMTKLGGLRTTTWRGTTYRGDQLATQGDRVAR